MIGTEAGAGDVASGVFRDLVATGRSRIALFLARIPAALFLTFACLAVGLAVAVVASFALADGSATPRLGLIASGAGWVFRADGIVCVIAVGLGSLTGSRAITLTALIGWELVLSPQLVDAVSFGSARQALLDGALVRIEPHPLPHGTPQLSMSIALVLVVMALWPLVTGALGAWRTATPAMPDLEPAMIEAHRPTKRYGSRAVVHLALVLLVAAWGVGWIGLHASEHTGVHTLFQTLALAESVIALLLRRRKPVGALLGILLACFAFELDPLLAPLLIALFTVARLTDRRTVLLATAATAAAVAALPFTGRAAVDLDPYLPLRPLAFVRRGHHPRAALLLQCRDV